MLSKTVTAHGKSARSIVASLRTHAGTLAAKSGEVFGPLLQDHEKSPDLGFLAELLARDLERRLVTLEAADEAHNDELSDDADPRRRRDESAQALYDTLLEIKQS